MIAGKGREDRGSYIREFSGYDTTPGHSGHFCTVLHANVKSEIKNVGLVARSEISNPECK